jgi:uncharacterized protein (UPF0371 family)
VDIGDYNMIDPFHLEAYGKASVNYNRDVAAFPVLRNILERITGGEAEYKSPTDMGVNRAGFGISDDEAVREASRQEIIRRYFRHACEYAMGLCEQEALHRAEQLLAALQLRPEDRSVVNPARRAAEEAAARGKGNEGVSCGAAIQLADGTVVVGKNSPLMHAASSLVLNAVKHLAGMPEGIHLLAPMVTSAIGTLKRDVFRRKTESLSLDETLIALSISSTMNPAAEAAMEKLKDLAGCEMHMTHIPAPGDEAGLKRLGVNVTSDPQFPSRNLFTG